MSMSKQLFVALILTLSYFWAQDLSAEPSPAKVSKAKWYYVETDNFSIVADVSKKNAAKLAQNLEKFRSLVALANEGSFPVKARPVKVFVTDSDQNYKLLTSYNQRLKYTGGFFRDTINGNYAVMRYHGSSSVSTLFHEYTHYLTANITNRNLPLWYSEGLAEFLGEMEFRRDNVVLYAMINKYHLAWIDRMQWLDTEKLFRTRYFDRKNRKDRKNTALIYSMSWLAVHYFRSDPELSKQLKQYLYLTQDGVDEAEALQQSMGITFKELNALLKSYSRKRRFKYTEITLKDPLTDEQLAVSKLGRADAAFHIGEYFLQAGFDTERAERYFDESLKHNPLHAGSLAGKANVAMYGCAQSGCKEAKSIVDSAKMVAPDDPFVATISGHINAKMMSFEATPEKKKMLRNSAVRDYNKAINSGGTNLEAISGAANLYAREGRWDKAYELYELVHYNAPSNHSARISMIRAHIARGEGEAAETIANRIRTNNHFSQDGLARFEKWYARAKGVDQNTEE